MHQTQSLAPLDVLVIGAEVETPGKKYNAHQIRRMQSELAAAAANRNAKYLMTRKSRRKRRRL